MSTDGRNDLPSANSPGFNQRVRETLQTFLGRQGNAQNRGLTVRDLVASGILNVSGRRSDGSLILTPGESVTAGFSETLDLTPPPTPSGFAVDAAIQNVFVSHDQPLYKAGHLRTHLYGKIVSDGDPLPTFFDAVEIGQFSGNFYAHPSNPATTWRLWIKWESKAGVLSPSPAGGINGLEAITGQDVSLLLTALVGEITESQLYADLNDRIDLIDGPESLDGSVAARLAAEALARSNADIAEAEIRYAALFDEARSRLDADQENAEAWLRNIIATQDVDDRSTTGIAVARSDLTTTIEAGLSAEATLRTTLAARLDTDIAGAVALVANEATARVTGDSAEATQRGILAAQILGADGTATTQGLIYDERIVRVSQENALAQQITLLSAGAGEQFDWAQIWYFDSGVESWTGVGTPTATSGWLRPADSATPGITSPVISIDGAKYTQIRLRIRKYGSPVWTGTVAWSGGSTTASEPTYDASGIGLVTINPSWTGSVTYISLALFDDQTATDYYTLDWAAIGRPSPGASSAQILAEQTVRAAEDSAIASSVVTLSAQVNNATTGLPAAHSAITSEASTRATNDTTNANAISALSSQVNDTATGLPAAHSAIVSEASTRATNDTTNANAISALSSQVNHASTGLPQTRADLVAEASTRATETSALAQETRTLRSQTDALSEAQLFDILNGEAAKADYTGTLALAREALQTEINDGLSAEAQKRLDLVAVLDGQAAVVNSTLTALATQDGVLAQSITTLQSTVAGNQAILVSDYYTKVDADSAISSATTALQSTMESAGGSVGSLSSNLTNNYYTKTGTDGAIASASTILEAYADGVAGDALDDASALITTVETTKIGYCTISGIASDHTTKSECEAASGVWHVGLPLATAVKQVSVSDGTTSAALEQRFTAQKTLNDGLTGQVTTKIDVNGKVSGYGSYASGTTSTFIANVNTFAVSIPETYIPLWTANTAYAKGAMVRVATLPTVSSFYLVCETGGTSGSTMPANAGLIGDKVEEGSVKWVKASRVPIAASGSHTTVDGVAIPIGAYMDGAYIRDATISSAKIGSLNADVINTGLLNAGHIGAGTISSVEITSAGQTVVGGVSVPSWSINGNGAATFNNAVVRGTVYATAGEFSGSVTIGGTPVSEVSRPVYFIGDFSSAPATATLKKNNVYKNTTDGNSYILSADGGSWGLYLATGTPGGTGPRGAAFATSTALSATDAAFIAASGISAAIDGDQLLLSNSTGSTIYTRISGSWSNTTALKVNGNAVIEGTLAADRISTGEIKSASVKTSGYGVFSGNTTYDLANIFGANSKAALAAGYVTEGGTPASPEVGTRTRIGVAGGISTGANESTTTTSIGVLGVALNIGTTGGVTYHQGGIGVYADGYYGIFAIGKACAGYFDVIDPTGFAIDAYGKSRFTGDVSVTGTINATGDITAYGSSDIRLKKNISRIKKPLEKLAELRGVMFDWRAKFIKDHGGEDGYFVRKHDTGVIAQEVQAVMPEVVGERKDGTLAVKYEKLVPLLIEAINELHAKVKALEAR